MIKLILLNCLFILSLFSNDLNSTLESSESNELKKYNTELVNYRLNKLEESSKEIATLKEKYITISNLDYYISFYSILITVIVLILAFKTSSDAKKEARSVLLEETQELKERYLQTIEEVKKASNEVLNSFLNESDVDIILNDKKTIEKEFLEIKIKNDDNYDYADNMIAGLYYYNKNEYKISQDYFIKAKNSTEVLFEQAKAMIFLEKSISFQHLSKISLQSKTEYYDKIIAFGKENSNNLALLKVVYQAYVYKTGRKVLLGDYNEALALVNEAMYKYDLPLTYYARAIYTKLLILLKTNNIVDKDKEAYIEEIKRINIFKDDKFKETILMRMETSFRYEQEVNIDIELIGEIFSNKFAYKDMYMSAVAEMFAILHDINNNFSSSDIKSKFSNWFETYYHVDYTYNFFTLNKWIDTLEDSNKKVIFKEYIEKFNRR